ncbi:MAG: SDR family NAD(P)-dependent oxidoreductase [Puniceicoccales bacterium]|jgi:NAD(P)-dependent dehydrogenase (short-subunit alcohol dehydrogenase family)|nr:SDR family NAD(P)-dependent oxidoreductase [Puniceicoccales bacterium]
MPRLPRFFSPRPFPCKEALVTGAGRGLGRAFANALLAEGVTVWGTTRGGTPLPDGVRPLTLDLAEPASVAALARQLRRDAPALDLLVNNAGAGVFCPFERFPEAELERQWRVLLASPVALCRAFFPDFARRGRGVIANVSSLAGVFPFPLMSAYSAAKAGLSAFSKTLLLEARGTGVRVIDFQPGDYATGFNDALTEPPAAATGAGADDGDNTSGTGGEVIAFDAGRVRRVRAAAERNLTGGPPPEHAARNLIRAIRGGREGTVVTGGVFEATLGPFAARFAPQSLVARFLRAFYDL